MYIYSRNLPWLDGTVQVPITPKNIQTETTTCPIEAIYISLYIVCTSRLYIWCHPCFEQRNLVKIANRTMLELIWQKHPTSVDTALLGLLFDSAAWLRRSCSSPSIKASSSSLIESEGSTGWARSGSSNPGTVTLESGGPSTAEPLTTTGPGCCGAESTVPPGASWACAPSSTEGFVLFFLGCHSCKGAQIQNI